MKEIIPFVFDGHPIRVLRDKDGSPLFVGKDICEALGYADPTNALKQHCRGVVKRHPIVDSIGRNQQVRVLSEGDMYRLMTHSKLESAERFETLVFDEILPTIRKTGSYTAPAANDQSGLDKLRNAQALKLAEETAAKLCNRFSKLGEAAQQVIFAKIINPIMGSEILALPSVGERLLLAGEVGKLLGVSGNRIGRIANQHGMKTAAYGEFRLDKSEYSAKQVEVFHYNAKAIDAFRSIIERENAGKVIPIAGA